MIGLNSALYIGLSGINTARSGLNVTGNNIANVNTEGYARQQAELITKGVTRSGALVFGTGSSIQGITAARNQLIETTLTQQTSVFGYREETYTTLRYVENIVNDAEGSGIEAGFQRLFESLEMASARPDQIGPRQEFLESASGLATEFRTRYSQLTTLQERTNLEIQSTVSEINQLTAQIATLNRQIAAQPSTPQNLLDERSRLINTLSDQVGIDVFEMNNHMVQINLKNTGHMIVGVNENRELNIALNPANANYFDVTADFNGAPVVINTAIEGGRLSARLQSRDTEIPAVKRRMDNLAAGLIQQVNSVHQTGIAMDGVTTGLNVFDPFVSGAPGPDNNLGAAAAIRLSTDVAGLPANLGFSATGSIGDNQIANQLAALRHNASTVDSDGDNVFDTGTFETYHHETLSILGSTIVSAEQAASAQEVLLKQTEERRMEISGVSLDEEAVNLTQFQRAFQASSRFVSVINQLTGDLIAELR
jgi:flagellar hook-associated protein 1 FlgK